MKVGVYNHQKDVPLRKTSVKFIVKDVLENEGFFTNEVSVHFVTSQEMSRLHLEFFNDPSPTDCISFPVDGRDDYSLGYHILGEVFICPKAAIDYQKTLLEYEITLYLVHGLLHLLGYDDIENKDIKEMRAAEKNHMERLMAKKLLLKL